MIYFCADNSPRFGRLACWWFGCHSVDWLTSLPIAERTPTHQSSFRRWGEMLTEKHKR